MVFVLLILIIAVIALHCLLRRKQGQASQNLTLKLGPVGAEGSASKNAIGQTAYEVEFTPVIFDGTSGRQYCTHCGKGTLVNFIPPTLLDKENRSSMS